MCAIPAIAKLAGGSPIGATVGSLFGIPGAIIGSRLMSKDKPNPWADNPIFKQAISQGVGRKKAMQTAMLVTQRNAAATAGTGY